MDTATKNDLKKFAWLVGIFLAAYFLPLGQPKVQTALLDGFRLLQWYAIHHTLACVVPAMFIAGAISTFLSPQSVLKYLGPSSRPALAYAVASVAGVVLAVCSCSVLPMFAGIYATGAGLGPATTFLYSGPAINVMAVFLSARVLGFDIGLARALGAILFGILIGVAMAALFRRSDQQRAAAMQLPPEDHRTRPLWKTALHLGCLVLFLVFSDWYQTNDVQILLESGETIHANIRYDRRQTMDVQPYEPDGSLSSRIVRLRKSEIRAIRHEGGFVQRVYEIRWYLAGLMGLLVLLMSWRWLSRDEIRRWMKSTWDFGLLIVPMLFLGVYLTGVAGGLIPEETVARAVGGNSLLSNFVASFVGMLWYFATLTEVPIVEMLTKLGMGHGPALALLLAGPALSLPSILVIYRVLGAKKTLAFCLLTVALSTVAGLVFGAIVG